MRGDDYALKIAEFLIRSRVEQSWDGPGGAFGPIADGSSRYGGGSGGDAGTYYGSSSSLTNQSYTQMQNFGSYSQQVFSALHVAASTRIVKTPSCASLNLTSSGCPLTYRCLFCTGATTYMTSSVGSAGPCGL
eukprot:7069242-Pyramimonas_sp.AAC.2